MDAAEIKLRVSMETVVCHYGGSVNAKGKGRCLFPDKHHHGDQDPSMHVLNDRVYCRSQQCFGEKGSDVFALVGIMEHLTQFADQKRRVMEIGGISDNGNGNGQRRIVRRFLWADAEGRTAYHLRWEPGEPKFMWAQDQQGNRPGRGACTPMLYDLDAVRHASAVVNCEGERDADTVNGWLQELGRHPQTVATTTPNGAGDVKPQYVAALRGKALVYLSGDNDEAGRLYLARCGAVLQGQVADLRSLTVPGGMKDWTAWEEAGATAHDFAGLLDQAEPYHLEEAERTAMVNGPWSKAQTAKDFLSAADPDLPILYASVVARGSITEWFSPRGIGKTHGGHWLAVKLAKEGKRVLLLDRDNSRREVKRRLKAWGAEELIHLKVLTRDAVPPLTDAEKWRAFPFQDFDLVLIDSLESSMEGCGEQDSAKPSRAIAPLLDIAHRENGPALLILGNTVRSGKHSRGSGVVEDRADVAFEVRDATDLKPSGTKDWWLELPAAGAAEWANRASRRKRRETYRLAFIASKYRIGEEPDPFIWEISMPDGELWTVRDVTADVVKAREDANKGAEAKRRATLDQAARALADQVRQRAEAGDPMLSDRDAIPYLVGDHHLTRKDARQLIKDQDGILWDRVQGPGKGLPQILVPVGCKADTAAEMPSEERPPTTSHPGERISTERMDRGQRKSGQTETTCSAGETASLFPPPNEVMPPRSSLCLQPLRTGERVEGNL